MNRLMRDLEPGNDLSILIDGNRGFQEAFPGLSGSLGIAELAQELVNPDES